MRASIGGWLLYFAIVATVIFIGWRQPLSYRFKSRAEVHALEHPATPAPAPTPVPPRPGAWMQEPVRTPLDGGALGTKHR